MPSRSAGAVFSYGSSLRERSLDETLRVARRYADRLGISRVTDITRLDRVGVPVFASIRPVAVRGSLCVNAGKGIAEEDARVGAYMEAIEYALCEYGASHVRIVPGSARQVLDGADRPEAILDFCPVMGAEIPLDAPLPCVEAVDIHSGATALVPAESVFLPTPRELIPHRYFGCHSNGVASGNTLLEATVHGLAEVIERDIHSFHGLSDSSVPVDLGTLPRESRDLVDAIEAAGLRVALRYQPTPFGIAWLKATVVDPDLRSHVFVNGGFGCHPHAAIAVVRAICEALQSRLSFIHGGRDDLVNRYRRFAEWEPPALAEFVDRLAAQVDDHHDAITFGSVPDFSDSARDLSSALDVLTAACARAGLERILRVAFTRPCEELQVVRIVVPRAEFFQETSGRVGVRLRDFVQAL